MSCYVMCMLCVYIYIFIYIHICVACVWICVYIYIYIDEYVTQCKTVCTFVCWCASIRTHMHIFRLAFERLFLPICRPSPFQVRMCWTWVFCTELQNMTYRMKMSAGYGSIPIDTFLVGWTSIYQLFWGSLGTRVLTHCQLWAILHPPVVREHVLEHFCLPILIFTWFSK